MKAMFPGLLVLVALAGCKAERPAESAAPAMDAVDQAVDSVNGQAVDQQAVDPPAADVSPSSSPTTGPMPAPGVITFTGFGPASFGASDEEVRMAWGKDLGDVHAGEPGGCYYLFPQPKPEGSYRIAFMIEGDKFARIDIDAADIVAPGGGKVGMSADEIRTLYAGRIEERPHKYVQDGKYFRIKDSAGGKGVLLFEIDTGKVDEWRIGVPPQIDYVEGCS